MDTARHTEVSIHADTYRSNAVPMTDTAYRYTYSDTGHVALPVQAKNSAYAGRQDILLDRFTVTSFYASCTNSPIGAVSESLLSHTVLLTGIDESRRLFFGKVNLTKDNTHIGICNTG
jgi:hypothetical protein